MSIKKMSLLKKLVFGFASVLIYSQAFAYTLPPIQQWNTPKGMRVYLVTTPDIPILDVLVAFDAGSARDDKNFGLANLTNNALAEGTQKYNADLLAERLESLGTHLNLQADRDFAIISLRTLAKPEIINTATTLLADLLAAPAFPAQPIERIKSQIVNQIQEDHQSIKTLADEAFYQALYQTTPYAHPVEGTTTTVSQLTRQQVQTFYKNYYVASNAVLVMVGNIDINSAKNISLQLDNALVAGKSATPLISMANSKAQRVHVEHPSIQSHLTMGQISLTREDPDYFPLLVGNQILGGNPLVSRLNDIIREQRGLVYFVYSYFLPLAKPGPFVINLETKQDQIPLALQLTEATLQKFINEGPSDQELQAAKNNLILGFPNRFDSNADILKNITVLAFYKLPLDYFNTFTQKIATVSAQQVKTAFQRKMHSDQMVIVTVGKSNNEKTQ